MSGVVVVRSRQYVALEHHAFNVIPELDPLTQQHRVAWCGQCCDRHFVAPYRHV